MWSLALVTLLACTCVEVSTTYYGGMGGVSPYYDPYMSYGMMGAPSFLDDRSSGEPEMLNCFASYLSDDGRNIASEIAVTIEQKRDSDDWDHGMGLGMGMGMGMGVGMGHGGYGMGGMGGGSQRGGLTARVELINNIDGGRGFIVFTKTARADDGCFKESFGEVMLPSEVNEDKHHGMGGYGMGGGMGGYGMGGGMGGYGGYGMMGYGYDVGMMGYGMGFGMGHQHDSMFGGDSREGEGIIAEINVTPGALTSAVIDDVGFTELSQLAGRGVLVCANVDYDWDWKPTCQEPYYSCCNLKYDKKGVSLTQTL